MNAIDSKILVHSNAMATSNCLILILSCLEYYMFHLVFIISAQVFVHAFFLNSSFVGLYINFH